MFKAGKLKLYANALKRRQKVRVQILLISRSTSVVCTHHIPLEVLLSNMKFILVLDCFPIHMLFLAWNLG